MIVKLPHGKKVKGGAGATSEERCSWLPVARNLTIHKKVGSYGKNQKQGKATASQEHLSSPTATAQAPNSCLRSRLRSFRNGLALSWHLHWSTLATLDAKNSSCRWEMHPSCCIRVITLNRYQMLTQRARQTPGWPINQTQTETDGARFTNKQGALVRPPHLERQDEIRVERVA